MRIQTEHMSFKNRWTISSSDDFQALRHRSQRRCWFSQTALLWFEVLPDMSPALSGASRLVVSAPRVVTFAPSYSEGRHECPPRVRYSPEIDASNFTLHILSDTPRGFQGLKYILLLHTFKITTLIHLRDQVTYVWSTSVAIWIHSATDCHVIRRTTYSAGQSWFNPHLPRCYLFLRIREYRLPGVQVSNHWTTTIRGVGRRVVARWGSVIILYMGDGNWRRFDLDHSWTSDLRSWVFE
jgi:hypothetical protein